jgi:hypothetical protein
LLKRLQGSPTKLGVRLTRFVASETVVAEEGWVLVNGGKGGKIALRPAGKPAKPGNVTRELVVYKKDGRWVAEEVRGLRMTRASGVRTPVRFDRGVEGASAPQAQLADLEKKMRALSDELEALRRQMKQAPQKQ